MLWRRAVKNYSWTRKLKLVEHAVHAAQKIDGSNYSCALVLPGLACSMGGTGRNVLARNTGREFREFPSFLAEIRNVPPLVDWFWVGQKTARDAVKPFYKLTSYWQILSCLTTILRLARSLTMDVASEEDRHGIQKVGVVQSGLNGATVSTGNNHFCRLQWFCFVAYYEEWFSVLLISLIICPDELKTHFLLSP